ncbi:TetR/AcrR family transcriptional regulator [Nocardia sp. BMG111209]|uniref:TetR/AcrR family transcriptional regulator n=1 Tax=Nocardia sp. BMG111209 TaxID=1160137 RepID=UPI000364D72B|nr:TetR/AcrR family transcriptional regulator [Nocardia sp. BMG111209]
MGDNDARRTDGRARVLSAAARCMVRCGYHGTTIRDIATEAGMTSAALYHHFQSKQQILVAIMSIALADARDRVDRAIAAAGPSPVPRFRAAVSAWALFHALRRDDALVGATEIRSLDPEHRQRVIEARDEQERIFRDLVAAGVAGGEFEVDDVEVATRALLTMGSAIATWFDPTGPLRPEQVAAEFVRLGLGMVRARG